MSCPKLYIECFRGTIRYARKKPKPAYYFKIVAANGEQICGSEAYNSAQSRNKTVALIMDAKIELT